MSFLVDLLVAYLWAAFALILLAGFGPEVADRYRALRQRVARWRARGDPKIVPIGRSPDELRVRRARRGMRA